MKTWQLNKTNITINQANTPVLQERAYAVPAAREQINGLGDVVIGEAWMISQPYQEGATVIKFAPPRAEKVDSESLALWAKCYRIIIVVAEREELSTLTIPLPGANPNVQGGAEAVNQAVLALSDQLHHTKHLRHLHLYAVDEDSVWALFKTLS